MQCLTRVSRRPGSLLIALGGIWLALLPASVAARTCTATELAEAVDQAGARLRTASAESMPRLNTRIRDLQVRRGWSEAEAEEKAYSEVQDDRIAAFDASANDLLAKIDELGETGKSGGLSDEISCERIDAVVAASIELQATLRAKSTYMLSRLASLAGDAPTTSDVPPAAPPAAAKSPASEKALDAKTATVVAPPPLVLAPRATKPAVASPAPAPAPAQPARAPRDADQAAPTRSSGWNTTTSAGPLPRDIAPLPGAPAPVPANPVAIPAPLPVGDGYDIDEIKRVGGDFFGQISTGLAAVLEEAFRKSGRPSGYILGTEGGGAFLAGLRYGSGTLYLRGGGTRPIHWHGPSLGIDVGGGGSKILFLVYKLDNPDELYARFSAIDGSAYIVGGVGATLVTNGRIVMAPIRSGIGLRLGASIGFIRFTPRPTWNPI